MESRVIFLYCFCFWKLHVSSSHLSKVSKGLRRSWNKRLGSCKRWGCRRCRSCRCCRCCRCRRWRCWCRIPICRWSRRNWKLLIQHCQQAISQDFAAQHPQNFKYPLQGLKQSTQHSSQKMVLDCSAAKASSVSAAGEVSSEAYSCAGAKPLQIENKLIWWGQR